MSESKKIPNRIFITMKEQKAKMNYHKFTRKCYYWLRNLLCNYSCLSLIGQKNLFRQGRCKNIPAKKKFSKEF